MPKFDTTGLELEKVDEFDTEGLDLESAGPELTAGRLGSKFKYMVRQQPGFFLKMQRSFLEAEDDDALDEKPSEYEFGLNPLLPVVGKALHSLGLVERKRTAIDDEYDQMGVPARTRVDEKARDYADKYPEREAFRMAVIEEHKAQRLTTINELKTLEQKFETPEEYMKSTGFLEDVVAGIGTSVPSFAAYVVGNLFGGKPLGLLFSSAVSYSQLHGQKIQELEAIGGIDAETKLKSAIFSGVTQAPLEALGNLAVFSKIMKANGTWLKWLRSLILEAGVPEGLTETLQQYPDAFATIMALNPDRTATQNLKHMADNIGEINDEALYSGKVGFTVAVVTAGVGGAGKVTIEKALNRLISPEQKAINEAKVARVGNIINKFESTGITEKEAAELREMFAAPETTEIQDIVKAVKEQLVFQEPIKDPVKDQIIQGMKDTGKFTDEQVDTTVALWDGMARSWADMETDRKPEQFYGEVIGEFKGSTYEEVTGEALQAPWQDFIDRDTEPARKAANEKLVQRAVALKEQESKAFFDQLEKLVAEGKVSDEELREIIKIRESTILMFQEYRGIHQAPDANKGSSGDDLTAIYPDDIYSPKGTQYYGDASPYDNESINIIKSMRGNPNKKVVIYRAVPKVISTSDRIAQIERHKAFILKKGKLPSGVDNYSNSLEYYDAISEELETLKEKDISQEKDVKINEGDWVTINRKYAVEHGYRHLNNKYKILRKTVTAKDITSEGNSIHEWGYTPQKKKMTFQDEKTPRGATEHLFGKTPKIIHAFESADISTPIHETGHILLETMFQGGHEDYLIAAEWAGVDESKALMGTKEWSTEQLEKFAKGFEVYLLEGKAPTTRLSAVFEKLKTWLLEVYKSVKALGVELNPEIREVFDRWVSTELERQNDPILEIPGWLKADDIKADMKRRELAEDESWENIEAEARRRVLGSLKAKRDKIEKDLEKEFRKEAKEMVNQNPIYEMLVDAKRRGLSWDDIVNDFGTGYLEDIVKRLPGVIKKGGEHVETFANEYGYSTADEMMQAVLNAPTKKQAEEHHYNDLWRGYETMLEHENTQAYEDVINEEINILNEMLGGKPKARKDLKGIIRKQTGQIKDQEYRDLKNSLKMDRRLAKQAYSAGKKEATIQQLEKTRQRIKALKDRIKDRDEKSKIDKRMKALWKDKNIPPEYKAQLTNILSVYYNIPKSYVIPPEVSLENFLLEKEPDNQVNVKAIRNALENIPEQKRSKNGYRIQLTLEEKQAMMQPVLSLAHMGRREKVLLTEKEQADFDEMIALLTTRGYEVFGQPEESENTIKLREKVSWFKKLNEEKRRLLAKTIKMEFITDVLDGGELDGPNSALFEKAVTALNEESELGKTYLHKLRQVFSPVKKVKKWAHKIHRIEGVPKALTKEQMFMVALQSGSPSGRNALMTGNGFSEPQIAAITNEIKNQGEWGMVEGVWDLFESLYPMLNEVHRKLTGISLKKIEGRYFPLKYDHTLSPAANKIREREVKMDSFDGVYERPKVEAGHRIERKEGAKPPVLLMLNVINQKLNESIHDITHQIPVRDLQKVIANKDYRAMVENTLGKEYYDQMMPWLVHLAKPRKIRSDGEKRADWLRRNTTVVALGLKVSVSLKQAGSITQTVDELNLMTGNKEKASWLVAKASASFYYDRKNLTAFIRESSPMMAARQKNWNRELMEFYNSTDVKDFKGNFEAKDAFFWMIHAVDLAVTMPSWYAGYNHGMERYRGDHKKSVRLADKLVRKTQPVASPADLSMIHRGGVSRSSYVKLITMFYTHFSNVQNRMWQTKQLHKLGRIDRVEAYASYWWIMIAPGLLGGFLGRRRLPEDWEWLTDILGYRLGGIPFLRDIAGAAITGYDYSMTPVERAFETVVDTITSPFDLWEGKYEKVAKNAVRLAGYIRGLPTDQALITMEGIIDLMEGGGEPQRLLFRRPKEKKKIKRAL